MDGRGQQGGAGVARARRLARTLAVAAVCLTVLALPAVAAPAFDPTLGELPEGIAIDRQGGVFVTMAPLGQIRAVAPDGSQATIAQVTPAGAGFGPLGLAFDRAGDLYVAAATFAPATAGVYRVADDGTSERIAGSEAIGLPNGLAFDDRGSLYVTDSVAGAVHRIGRDGSVEPWTADPLLEGDGSFGFGVPFGANGIAHRHGALYVAVTEKGRIVRIPIGRDGDAGAIEVVAEDPLLVGADGIAFDVRGNLYVAANAQNALRRLTPGGDIETLATAAGGLDFPSSLAFGRGPLDHGTLLVTSFAAGAPGGAGPGIVAIDAGVPGQPLP